ncbi:MAG: hypothetical protein ACFE9L_20535 [Candidatus Hodarchaeota archaeon]
MADIELIQNNFNRFKEVQEKTIEAHQQEIVSLIRVFNEDYYRYLGVYKRKLGEFGLDRLESLLQACLWEYYLESRWILYSIVSGCYHQAYREMRFLMESWAQAYHIDQIYIKKTFEEKVKCDELRLYGKRLIYKAFYESNFASELYNLYNELSKFVHGSKEELEKYSGIEHPLNIVGPFYDRVEFVRCLNHLKQLHEYLMKMLS